MKFDLKVFDIVVYHKIHENVIFYSLSKNEDVLISSTKNIIGNYNSKYVKSRPGIILEILKEMKNKKYYDFIIVALTSKKPQKWEEKYRTKLNFLGPNSYIMWDSLQRINSYQVKQFMKKDGKRLRFSNSAKKFICKEALKNGYNLNDMKKYIEIENK